MEIFVSSFVIISIFRVILADHAPEYNAYGDNSENEIYYDYETEDSNENYKVSAYPTDKSTSKICGIDVTSENRIVGGKPTGLKQYPWLAAIEFRDVATRNTDVQCGGSLISGRYVVSAAHCFADIREILPINVILGDYDISHDGPDCIESDDQKKVCTDGEVRIPIQKIIIYPRYDTSLDEDHPLAYLYDVALIRLASMVSYTDAIRPICLPSIDLNLSIHKSITLFVAGWGIKDKMFTNDIIDFYETVDSPIKRHVDLPFVDPKQCQRIYLHSYYRGVIMNQICAGGGNSKDSCNGDSGGPLMFNNGGRFELSGVVSYGPECATEGVPGVYTNVYRYKGWIIDEINYRESLESNSKS